MENSTDIRLVVIGKSPDDAIELARSLQKTTRIVLHEYVPSLESFTNLLGTAPPDLVILKQDKSLPGIQDFFIALQKHAPATPLIYLSDDPSEAALADALGRGASAAVIAGNAVYLAQIATSLAETSRLKQENSRRKSQSVQICRFANQLFETTTEAMVRIEDGKFIHANPAYLQLFGFNEVGDLVGKEIHEVIDAEDREDFISFLESFDGECVSGKFNGISTSDSTIRITATVSPDVLGSASGFLVTFISDQQNAMPENKRPDIRKHDLLTGLANRRHFTEELGKHIARDQAVENEKALVFVLLDQFKALREEIGIVGSDMVLFDIGKALEGIAGSDDLVSRFGDHAFTILHKTSGTTTPQGFAERVRTLVESHISNIEGRAITLTCSIGICVINKHLTCAEDALSRAELACEVAHSSSGNQIHTHSTTADKQAGPGQEKEQVDMIRKTIDDERFYLVYQPIVGLNGNSGCQYEILLRIIDEKNEVILPGQFISIAEKTGLCGEIDRWVIENAMKKLAELQSNESDPSFFIKVSGSTISDRSLPQWVSEKLTQYCIKGDAIVFEIPMHTACHNHEHTRTFISSMKNLHCRIALEHFSYEKDQLQLLQHLPADILKIDGVLVNNLVGNKDNQNSIKAIIALARKHNMQSIAERVDDVGNLAFLWQFGIDFIQGNFVQEPTMDPGYDFEEQVA